MLTSKVKTEIMKWVNYFNTVIGNQKFTLDRHDATIEAVSGQVLELQHMESKQENMRKELDALYNHLGIEFKPQNLKFDIEMIPEHFEKVKKGQKK